MVNVVHDYEVKQDETGVAAAHAQHLKVSADGGINKLHVENNAADLPNTGSAPAGPWRQVVEGSDGKEYLLRSGTNWRENHDGTVTMRCRSTPPFISAGQRTAAITLAFPVAIVPNSNVRYSYGALNSDAFGAAFFGHNALVLYQTLSATGVDIILENPSSTTSSNGWVDFIIEGATLA